MKENVLPMFARLAPLETIDVEKRTVELIFTTGATVRRRSWDGVFDEVLLVSDAAVNLDRLRLGAPLLNSHARYTLDDQIGVVESARIAGDKGYALVRFPTAGVSKDADQAFGMVQDKIVRNVSTGYSVDQVRVERSTKEGAVDKWIVERWTPFEISLVTIPADAGAQTRADDAARTFPVELIGRQSPAFDAVAARARMRMRQAVLNRHNASF